MHKSNRVLVIVALSLAVACTPRSAAPADVRPVRPTVTTKPTVSKTPTAATPATPAALATPPTATPWRSVDVVPVEPGELVDVATAKSNVCALYASGLAVCVDVLSRVRTVVFAANPSLALRGPLKLRVADELLCVASAWSVMCRSIDGSAMPDERVAEVRLPRGEWLLDSVRREICTMTDCVSVNPTEPAAPATPMFATAGLADAGPLRRSLVTAENRWALDECPTQNGRGCLSCEGNGLCAKWRKVLDIMRTPPKMPRRTTCVNGPNQVERCPPEPRARPIVLSDAAKRALIEKAWPTTTGTVSVGLVAELPNWGRQHRLVGNVSVMCVVSDEDAGCATASTPPHTVAWLPEWRNRNVEPLFVWATRLCALSRRDFRVTCSDIDRPSAGAIIVNLPSTTQLQTYTGVVAASAKRLCYSDPRGGVTCLTADALAPVELEVASFLGPAAAALVSTPNAARAARAVSSARYFSDRYVTLFGPYMCRGENCQHAVTAVRATTRELPTPKPMVLSPRATQEFASYERRPSDNGVMACVPPVPKRNSSTNLERLADVTLPTVPMRRGGTFRCTGGHDAGFDVDVPATWGRIMWWGSAACYATGSTVNCLPIREGGRKLHSVHVGFTIFAVDASSELLCASAEAETTAPVCWWLDPTAPTFVPVPMTVPADLRAASPTLNR